MKRLNIGDAPCGPLFNAHAQTVDEEVDQRIFPRAALDIEVGGFNANASDVWNFFDAPSYVEIARAMLPQNLKDQSAIATIQVDEVTSAEALVGNSEKHSKGSTTTQQDNGQTERLSGSMQPTQPQPIPPPIPVSVPVHCATERAPYLHPDASHSCRGWPPTLAHPGHPATFGRNLLPLPHAHLRNPPARAHPTQPKVKQRSPQSLTRELLELRRIRKQVSKAAEGTSRIEAGGLGADAHR